MSGDVLDEPTRQRSDTVLDGPPVITQRFGPGVPREPAAVSMLAKYPPLRKRRRRRRLLLATVLPLLLLIGLLAWWLRPGPSLSVSSISVDAPATVACQESAELVAHVRTNGAGGDISYHWQRNDQLGQPVTEIKTVPVGERETTVHLRWSFEGPGRFEAVATIEILEPDAASAVARFTYICD